MSVPSCGNGTTVEMRQLLAENWRRIAQPSRREVSGFADHSALSSDDYFGVKRAGGQLLSECSNANLFFFRRGRTLQKPVIFFAQRQPNFETGAFAGLADDKDFAFVPRDDAVRSRESEAATKSAFCREEWLKDP